MSQPASGHIHVTQQLAPEHDAVVDCMRIKAYGAPCPAWLQIEAAYDVLFMQSMKKRISGELEVSTSVRYADVPTRKRSSLVSRLDVMCY